MDLSSVGNPAPGAYATNIPIYQADIQALDTEIGWVVRFRDGLGVWGRAYQSHAEALEAAGLSE